ncbi:helix-loop-helix protein 11 isoform X2 [Nilaparvata lugens]|uniref:helix-loop-helix protein 11 isoform X2 n=1 Tax=Nilaparvata lugens TaxID=108931 RepID=UPI00193E195A|nr:helix-loop-helix protein 11 isoform X2 [Nilaparvata lugens]
MDNPMSSEVYSSETDDLSSCFIIKYEDDSEDDLRRGLPSRRSNSFLGAPYTPQNEQMCVEIKKSSSLADVCDYGMRDEDFDNKCIRFGSLSGGERPESPLSGARGAVMEQEKRIRREIANSNERRRMQSINAGFQSLRTLLPHHEGEKLSKAAILQQTAEYIYQLEQEKTRLLSQNCQLKRLINQHEGEATAPKKRKTEAGVVVMTPNDTADPESVAALLTPEPLAMVTTSGSAPTIITAMDVSDSGATVAATGGATGAAANSDLIELRSMLDRERGLRMILEDQVRSLETQLYPERIREITHQVQLQYQQRDEEEMQPAVITPIRRESGSSTASESAATGVAVAASQQQQETAAAVATLQVVSAASLQPVAHTETVIATVNATPPASPKAAVAAASKVAASVAAAPSTPRLTILEAAIKAEPKVEVERIPSPSSPAASGDELTQARVYLASTSRQNLETIVEAIRHLEGDALFSNEEGGAAAKVAVRGQRLTATPVAAAAATTATQDAPLALTKSTATTPRLLKVEMNQFLQFNSSPSQQQRPGVIVVKQHT